MQHQKNGTEGNSVAIGRVTVPFFYYYIDSIRFNLRFRMIVILQIGRGAARLCDSMQSHMRSSIEIVVWYAEIGVLYVDSSATFMKLMAKCMIYTLHILLCVHCSTKAFR